MTPADCGVIVYSCEVISGSRTDLCSVSDSATSTSGSFDPVTGNYSFKTYDLQSFPAGSYTFRITGTADILSTSQTFIMTLVDPCPTSTLTLIEPSLFTDQVAWRREDSVLSWSTGFLVTQSATVDCGVVEIEFFNDDSTESALDQTIFSDDRAEALIFKFTVLQAVNGDLKIGSYPILYRAYLADYPDVKVAQTTPFTVEIVDPCGRQSDNTLTFSQPEDQTYTITDNELMYEIPAF